MTVGRVDGTASACESRHHSGSKPLGMDGQHPFHHQMAMASLHSLTQRQAGTFPCLPFGDVGCMRQDPDCLWINPAFFRLLCACFRSWCPRKPRWKPPLKHYLSRAICLAGYSGIFRHSKSRHAAPFRRCTHPWQEWSGAPCPAGLRSAESIKTRTPHPQPTTWENVTLRGPTRMTLLVQVKVANPAETVA